MNNQPKVIIYTAVWCAFCHATKEYLNKLGVVFEERDVEKDPNFGMEAVNKSGQRGIPVLDIENNIIVGFDRPRIDAALKSHKLI